MDETTFSVDDVKKYFGKLDVEESAKHSAKKVFDAVKMLAGKNVELAEVILL